MVTFSEIYLGITWCGRLVFIDFDGIMSNQFLTDCFFRKLKIPFLGEEKLVFFCSNIYVFSSY